MKDKRIAELERALEMARAELHEVNRRRFVAEALIRPGSA